MAAVCSVGRCGDRRGIWRTSAGRRMCHANGLVDGAVGRVAVRRILSQCAEVRAIDGSCAGRRHFWLAARRSLCRGGAVHGEYQSGGAAKSIIPKHRDDCSRRSDICRLEHGDCGLAGTAADGEVIKEKTNGQ